jgi:hypothetical protein
MATSVGHLVHALAAGVCRALAACVSSTFFVGRSSFGRWCGLSFNRWCRSTFFPSEGVMAAGVGPALATNLFVQVDRALAAGVGNGVTGKFIQWDHSIHC